MTEEPLDFARMGDLLEAFVQSDLPFQVDIVDWASTSESFREIIEEEYVVVPSKSEDKNNNWSTIKIGNCAILSGQTILPSNAIDLPYIGLEHIEKDQLHLIEHGKASNVSSAKTHFFYKDILFGKLRPYFRKIIMAPFEGICSTDIWVIRSKENVDQSFLFYCLASQPFIDFATRSSEGTRMPRAKWDYVSQYEIQLPPLPEQLSIAHILGSLDDEIELNREMSGTLEEMAQALFKSWFVDFDPVRAKMEGRWRRGESLPGLPADLWELFPSSVIKSEMGEIPEGWEFSTIGQEVDVVGGSTPSTKVPSFWNGDINWATPKDLSSLRSPILINTSRKITPRGLAKISSGLLPKGTVLLSSRAPIGYIAITDTSLAINQGFIAMKCRKRLSLFYIWLWTSTNMRAILNNANGSTFQEISKSNFRPLPIVVPSEPIRQAYDQAIKTLYHRIVINERLSQTLAGIRDTLLSKLISGELRVT